MNKPWYGIINEDINRLSPFYGDIDRAKLELLRVARAGHWEIVRIYMDTYKCPSVLCEGYVDKEDKYCRNCAKELIW